MVLNACELEIDLFCRGLRVTPDVSLAGVRGLSRTRAGLGSGLEMAIPSRSRIKGEVWVNAPVVEPFARTSPYRLAGNSESGHIVVDDRSGTEYPVRLPAEPDWYTRLTSRDVPMQRIGVLQGTYLAIYVNPVCAFWSPTPALNCKFCTTGCNVGPNEAVEKSVDDVVETCWAAKQESGITFAHLNGGFQGSHGIEHIKPYVQAIKEKVGLLVGVQLAPEFDLQRYDELVALGVDHLSFCLELLDPRWFARICPGKARVHGQKLYFDAMKHCVDLLPSGAVSGEIIAGLEPIEKTLEAIDRITAIGAFPTVCIFRPTVGSELENWPVPTYTEMRRVMQHMYDACRRAMLPIGVAPNIEVSLVVNPDDAAMLAEPSIGVFGYEAYRRMLRLAARRVFRQRMRPH
jgi:hypothetical protein